jgi:hypothetical protein
VASIVLLMLDIASKRVHPLALLFTTGATARFTGKVGRLKKNKDSARIAE